jgi:hypothetical protein
MVCPDSNGLAEPTFVLELDRIVQWCWRMDF